MTHIVHNTDAITFLRGMLPESVDAVVTDPPYGDTSCPWDNIVAGWLGEVRRVLKPSGSVWFFTSLRHLLAVAPMLKGWTIAQEIVWEKHNGSGLMNDRFRRVHELAVQLYPSRVKWGAVFKAPQFTMDARARQIRTRGAPAHYGTARPSRYTSIDGGPRLMRSVLRVRSTHGRAIHPTQKPEGIVRPLVLYSCPPGGVVLDCFAGSGTTGVVCAQEGRHFIGIERDAEMAEKARGRIAEALAAGPEPVVRKRKAKAVPADPRQETLWGVA